MFFQLNLVCYHVATSHTKIYIVWHYFKFSIIFIFPFSPDDVVFVVGLLILFYIFLLQNIKCKWKMENNIFDLEHYCIKICS